MVSDDGPEGTLIASGGGGDPLVGRTLGGDFRVDSFIGAGAMGRVYQGTQLSVDRIVAIKVLPDELAANKGFVARFLQEGRLAARVEHPAVVRIYSAGESAGIYYIAMEFLRGESLRDYLARQGALSEREAVARVRTVAEGLAAAHAVGIVHRDVKPDNIMLTANDQVKLTDFGIAKARGFLTDQEGEVVAGKADFMSPEQANFQITDKRSDLFSAGVVLAHLLLGRNIFKGASTEESRSLVMNLPIPDFRQLDDRVDDRLNEVLHRALARDLGKRYGAADELLYDLEHYIYHTGYGPTNETLGKYIRELFGETQPTAGPAIKGQTELLEQTVRVHSKS